MDGLTLSCKADFCDISEISIETIIYHTKTFLTVLKVIIGCIMLEGVDCQCLFEISNQSYNVQNLVNFRDPEEAYFSASFE